MRELSVAEQRYQAVLAVISDGLSISQVASKVGVSGQTLHIPVPLKLWLAPEAAERKGGQFLVSASNRIAASATASRLRPLRCATSSTLEGCLAHVRDPLQRLQAKYVREIAARGDSARVPACPTAPLRLGSGAG
jgi:transposase-like protein